MVVKEARPSSLGVDGQANTENSKAKNCHSKEKHLRGRRHIPRPWVFDVSRMM
jgi:hypothetical protein